MGQLAFIKFFILMHNRAIIGSLRVLLLAVAIVGGVMCAHADDKKLHIHYMGTVEAGNLFPWDGFMKDSSGLATLNTTHGVVITPWLYTGLGAGVWMAYTYWGVGFGFPVYGDVRVTYPNRRWRPFFDLKVGALAGEYINHLLFMPSVGIKFAIKDTFGIYLSAGTLTHFESFSTGLSLNLGFDF